MSGSSTGAVVLRDLCVTLGSNNVLVDMSYAFPASTVTVVLGPNGAGKTTLLRTLIGVIRPRKGGAFIMDHPVGSSSAKSRIGYLAEVPGLYERLSALDNILFHAKMRGFQGQESKEQAIALLRKYGLEGFEKMSVHKFSKGMKQRLALARTTFGNPPVLLLDEPTSGLDPDGSELVIGAIRDAAREGASVIMTTHNAYLARRVSDSVILIKGGRVAASGAFDDVLRPYDSVRVKLLAPAQPSMIRAALTKFSLRLEGNGAVGEFLVTVSGKADIPSMIRAMIEGGLQPVTVEPGEITYEGGGK
jgi:ABC-2 type transport system ATP-binding protein